MKRFLSLLLILLLLPSCAALAQVERSPYLDVAFSTLEEGNPFVARYNELTGAQVVPLYKTGVPYFFGAQDARYLYTVRKITQQSKYGNVGQKCIWGFDCTGFTRWLQDQVGDKRHPGLTDMILKYSQYRDYRMDDLKGMAATELHEHLQAGDFLAAKHGGRHILMYIGTLRDYGFDEESAGEMSALLDYPLMINCGNDPNYIERTQAYIDENQLSAQPSKGGVTISVVGVTEQDAPHLTESGAKPFYYYQLAEGYQVSVYDLTTATSFVWWRTPEKDRGTAVKK